MEDILNIKPNVVNPGVEGKFFLFYGEPSTRKTSVACLFPKSLLLATEVGYSLIPDVHAANIKSWPDFKDVVRQLKNADVQEAYKTIVIDTIGLLTDMCMKYTCDVKGIKELSEAPWGQGWAHFKKEFRTQINTIAQLGYGIVFIAHTDPKTKEDGTLKSAMPLMEKKPREAVIALVDFILYLQKEVADYNPDLVTVYAYSNLASNIETKTRARYLSPRFEFNFENLGKEVEQAIRKNAELTHTSVSGEGINLHKDSRMPFEELKADVLRIGAGLTFPGVDAEELSEAQIVTKNAAIEQLTTIMKGTRVSQATEHADYDKLLALREALIEVQENS